jgi:hypothetical protein
MATIFPASQSAKSSLSTPPTPTSPPLCQPRWAIFDGRFFRVFKIYRNGARWVLQLIELEADSTSTLRVLP